MLEPMISDLHTHTTASDGKLSPAELLGAAADAGVSVLAITDHDTVAGLLELHEPARGQCSVIAGIELSTTWKKTGIHILGLNIDPGNATLAAGIRRQQTAREQRAEIIAARLAKLGLVDTLAGAAAIANDTAQLARPHFAQYLVESGQVGSLQLAYRKYLGPGKAGDVRDFWPPMPEVIDWIAAAGGVAVLAHPGKYRLSKLKLAELVQDFRAAGGRGLEVISGQQEPALTAQLGALANRHGLYASCGSDFHGPGQIWAQLGKVAALPPEALPVWEAWAR